MEVAIATEATAKTAMLPDGTLKKALAKANQTKAEAAETEPQYPQSLIQGGHRFDYSKLELPDALKLKSAAESIRGRESRSLIADGKEFIRIKDLLDHGQFTAWFHGEDLRYNLKMKDRAMSVARLVEKRSKHLEALPVSILYDLAAKSLPDDVKDRVSAEADRLGRTPDPHWVRQQIDAAKSKKSAKAASAKKDVVASDPKGVQPSDDLQEVELRGQKTRDAVSMLTDALGDDFPKFVDLFDGVDFMEFKDTLHHARAKFTKEAA